MHPKDDECQQDSFLTLQYVSVMATRKKIIKECFNTKNANNILLLAGHFVIQVPTALNYCGRWCCFDCALESLAPPNRQSETDALKMSIGKR